MESKAEAYNGDGNKTYGNDGILLPRWLDHPAAVTPLAPEVRSEGRLMARTSKSTLLAGPAGGWGGKAGRRQRLLGVRDPGSERGHLSGVGPGPAEAVAGAKQEYRDYCVSATRESGRVGQKWVSRHLVATCQ
jgi:hypothetical protein